MNRPNQFATVSRRPDIEGDTQRVIDVLRNGGIAICPNHVGYGIWSGSNEGAQKVFETKQRGGHKRHAIVGDLQLQRELHLLDRLKQDMIECITQDYDLPVGVVAPYRPEHPLMRKLDPEMLKSCTARGTLGMLINGGPMHEHIGRFAREELHPVFGSSANLSGTGTKFRVQDIQPEVRAIADIIVDRGLRRYHTYKCATTGIDFENMKVIRFGSCYELIADVLKRHFDVDLPADPGRDALPSGHVHEYALVDVN